MESAVQRSSPLLLSPLALKEAAGYLKEVNLQPIDKAWELIEKAHRETKHFSGEPQLAHALRVAMTLAAMRLDLDTIVAGLLHGVLKEGVDMTALRQEFGNSVAQIVDGCTKITKVQYNSKLVHQADNVRKMLLAIAADVRVLLVKLADRLQDMRVLESLDKDAQQEIARETRDLYAPFAGRLGIDWMKRELEELSFKYLCPDEYEALSRELESSLEERQAYVDEVVAILYEKLHANGLHPKRVFGRSKHLYSIYKKLVAQNITLDRVYDKVAFRIIVDTVNECYESLGIIHVEWAPVPGRIKDFISIPKSNNYQSLHTTVVGPHGHFIEIQIRTEEMDRVALEGVAAHWAYKEGQNIDGQDAKLFRELKNLVNGLQEVEDPREFLESVRGELYEADVYALTPKGEVKELPVNSCPIDFAYAIHSEVGHHCAGAKVNGRLVPLKYTLQNGDVIEIITSSKQRPRRGWLEFVKTSRARARIRSWFRKEDREKALLLGREICEKELKHSETSLKKLVKSGEIRQLLKSCGCNTLDDLLVKVGLGSIPLYQLQKYLKIQDVSEGSESTEPQSIQEQTLHMKKSSKRHRLSDAPVQIDGVEDMLVKISQCCNPVPGDPIIGFITLGRGVSIHKADCYNLRNVDPRRFIEVSWTSSQGKKHRVGLAISAENRCGILAEVSAALSADSANIVDISAHTTPVDTAEIKVTVEVENLDHLQRVIQHLRQMKDVITVKRR